MTSDTRPERGDMRDEDRWVAVDQHGTVWHNAPDESLYITPGRFDEIRCLAGETPMPICRTDLGESILQPGQVAVSREEIDRIFAIDLPGGDNIAIALATYFEGLPDCPEDDVDDETGWSQWAMDRVSDVENLVKRHLLTSPAADQPKPEVLVPAKGPVTHPKYTIHQTEQGGLTTKPVDQPGSDPEREGGGE